MIPAALPRFTFAPCCSRLGEKTEVVWGIGIMSGLSEQERQVFDYFVSAIAERRLAPGIRLVEADLAEKFGVSRGRIRRVLLALGEAHGVRHEANRGAHVARPSLRESKEIIQSRILIERQLVIELVAQGDAPRHAAADKLNAHVEREKDAQRRRARGEQIRLSGRFHVLICEALDNRVMAEILERLVLLSSLALATHAPTVGDQCGPDEHQEIVKAIRDGNAQMAAALIEHHLHHVEEAFEDVEDMGIGLS
jgi:DNA-binding GntR family transcriptional regulator